MENLNRKELNWSLLIIVSALFIFSPTLSFSQDPLKGETKIEDPKTAIENILMGNISVSRSADKLAGLIRNYDPGIKSIVIYDKEKAEALAGYEKTLLQLQDLVQRYNSLLVQQKNSVTNFRNRSKLNPCPSEQGESLFSAREKSYLGLEPVTSLVKGSVGLLSYFRTDVELRPEVFDVDEKVVIAEVFRGLRGQYGTGIKLYNSSSIPLPFTDSEMIKTIEKLVALDEDTEEYNEKIINRIALLKCNSSMANPNDEQEYSRLASEYKKINQKAGQVIQSLSGELPSGESSQEGENKDSKPKVNLLAAYLNVENIYQLLRKSDNGYWLEVKAVKAGGTTRVKTNLIADVFTGGNRVSHSGASLLEYNLYDKTGMSVLSGTIPYYIPFTKPKKISDLNKSLEEERINREPIRPNLKVASKIN